MLLMKTDTVTIPLYGNYARLDGQIVAAPLASGHFARKTRKISRELAFFRIDSVEGRVKDGWETTWPEGVVMDVSDLVAHGHLYLFEDLEALKAAMAEEIKALAAKGAAEN